jgi:kynurenine formamidase
MEVLDLSKKIEEGISIPREDGYEDPGYKISNNDPGQLITKVVGINPWVTLSVKDFSVTELIMGAHTGTHCDVECHIRKDGATVTDYPIETWVGWAAVLDLCNKGQITADIIGQFKPIFNRNSVIAVIKKTTTDFITKEAREALIQFRPKAVILGRGSNQDGLDDTKGYLLDNIPMIMDADFNALDDVENGDLIVAAPLKLSGVEASPIRLIAIRGLVDTEE